MPHRYAIKGMVCHRCDLALAEVGAATGAAVVDTGRGYAEFAERLPPEAELAFSRDLAAIRFSILRTEGEEVAEAVELALRSLLPEHPDLSTADAIRERLAPSLDTPYERAAALFREETGQTPLSRFQTLRMQWAGERLREGRLQVSEVGYVLGYRHLSGFSRAFKREMGVSPAEWGAAASKA